VGTSALRVQNGPLSPKKPKYPIWGGFLHKGGWSGGRGEKQSKIGRSGRMGVILKGRFPQRHRKIEPVRKRGEEKSKKKKEGKRKIEKYWKMSGRGKS